MKNSDPKSRSMKFGSLWDRIVSISTLVFFLVLVYLAVTGRFDHEINHFAEWLKRLFT